MRLVCVHCKHPVNDWNETHGICVCPNCYQKDLDDLKKSIEVLRKRIFNLEHPQTTHPTSAS